MRAGLVGVAIALVLAACGGDPEIPTVLVNDQCRFDGPTRVEEGAVRFTLQRTGLGDYGAAVVHFQDGHGVAELEDHFERVTQVWDERPEWIGVRYLLQVDDDELTSPRGETVVMDLQPGEHAVVCIDYNYPEDRARVAAQLEVFPAEP